MLALILREGGGLELRVTSTGRKYLLWSDLTLNPSLRNRHGTRPGDLLMLPSLK